MNIDRIERTAQYFHDAHHNFEFRCSLEQQFFL